MIGKNEQAISGKGNIQAGNNAYVTLDQSEKEDFGIIEEIINHVALKAGDGDTVKSRAESLLDTQKKIELNFIEDSDRHEVQTYFTLAYSKLNLVETKFAALDTEDQDDIHAYLLSRYKTLVGESDSSIEVLRKLFQEILPNGKKNNPKYINAAHAFILLFFDDCTIFEKTEKQKLKKPKNIFSDI